MSATSSRCHFVLARSVVRRGCRSGPCSSGHGESRGRLTSVRSSPGSPGGRTIREYVFDVLVLRSAVTVIWFAALGGSALRIQLSGARNGAGAASENPEAALFELLSAYPFPIIHVDRRHRVGGHLLCRGCGRWCDRARDLLVEGSLHPSRWLTMVWGRSSARSRSCCSSWVVRGAAVGRDRHCITVRADPGGNVRRGLSRLAGRSRCA